MFTFYSNSSDHGYFDIVPNPGNNLFVYILKGEVSFLLQQMSHALKNIASLKNYFLLKNPGNKIANNKVMLFVSF